MVSTAWIILAELINYFNRITGKSYEMLMLTSFFLPQGRVPF